ALAALHPEHEHDDQEDREDDEQRQPQERRQAGGDADRPARAAGPSWSPGAAFPLDAPPLGRLLGLRLVEEVEVDVGVALGHGRWRRSRTTVPVGPVGKGTLLPRPNRGLTMTEAATTAGPGELVLDRYRPLRPLGNGGSGSVWLARGERTGLEVALKIVAREGKAGPRAQREAAVAAQLRHERCLRAYACASDGSHVYIAYEYAPGRTLREAMRAGELDDRSAVEAGAQILEGLAHAHAHGVVHRDVKPANVLLADGDEISVRLLDFGLARMEEAETLTGVGDVPGTLAYISPERLAGGQSGPAGDVWAVGVLLWEALAGTHPFWASSLLGTARSIEAGAPPLASMRPDLPRRLTGAIDRALAPEPDRRPSAARLAQALRLAFEERERRASAPRIALRRPRTDVLLAATGAAVAT